MVCSTRRSSCWDPVNWPETLPEAIIENKDCGYQVAAVVKRQSNGRRMFMIQEPCQYLQKWYTMASVKTRKPWISTKSSWPSRNADRAFPSGNCCSCRVDGIEVIEGTSFYEMLTGKLLVEKINPSWLIFSEGFRKSWLRKVLKRTGDLILSCHHAGFYWLRYCSRWPS